MNILESIMGASGGNVVSQLAQKFGIQPQDAQSALASLLPQLTGGLSRNASSAGGLEDLLGALQSGQHQRYVEDPATLAQPETTQDGNNILAHILGSKDVSRNVAQQAAAKTGLDVGMLKQMLPIAATVLMGYLAKKRAAGAGGTDILGSLTGGGGITSMLDADKDGKVEASDLIDMAKKIF